ncbi:hypothetical protein DENSPDRAFT_882291 [Dentipellis sp. KUC8613]|nr:hypothetical protein DENSPDRAFT_882291 [Dentipellis sp. KUC8613]
MVIRTFLRRHLPLFPSQYGQPVASSSTTTLSTSSHDRLAGSDYVALHSRAQKAAEALLSPGAKQQMAEDERKRKMAMKAQNKRNRDVDDRVALNSVLPEDRRAVSNPPGLVEVIRSAIDYIPKVRDDLRDAQEQIADLENALELATETNLAIGTVVGIHDDDDDGQEERDARTTYLLTRSQNEISQLKNRLAALTYAAP